MPTKGTKEESRPITAPPPRSSQNVTKRNESEAQIRGFYGSSPSPITHLGRHELTKRPREDEPTEPPFKRLRYKENEHSDNYDDDDRHTPVPGSSTNQHTGKIRSSGQLTISTQAPGKVATPLSSNQPSMPSRDPRQGFSTPQSLQKLPEPPQNSFQHGTSGVGGNPPVSYGRQVDNRSNPSVPGETYLPPASSGQENHPALAPSPSDGHPEQAPTRNDDHLVPASAPNEHFAGLGVGFIDVRMKAFEEGEERRKKAFEEEERIRQKQHDEARAERMRRQVQGIKHELESNRDQAKEAAVQKVEEAHERSLAELHRRSKTG